MTDSLTPEQRRKNMSHIRSCDTSIELVLRKALWHAGIRYRKNMASLPGKPDIVLTKYRIAIFCDSEFFHGKDFATKKPVSTNKDYWQKKIRRNIERDQQNNAALQNLGWVILRFWGRDILKHTGECVNIIVETIVEQRLRKMAKVKTQNNK